MAEFSNNRKLGNRSTDFVSVKDFGAALDGVTDDSAALQAAIDFFDDKGGTVLVPGHCFIDTATITIKPGITVTGRTGRVGTASGYNDKIVANAGGRISFGSYSTGRGGRLKDLALINNGTTGIWIDNSELASNNSAYNCTIDHCYVTGGQYSVRVDGTVGFAIINNSQILNNSGSFDTLYAIYCGDDGTSGFEFINGMSITDCYIAGRCHFDGTSDNGGGGSLQGVKALSIKGIQYDGRWDPCWRFKGCPGMTMDGAFLENEGSIDISNITQASPGVVTTSSNHWLENGDVVRFNIDAGSMVELDGNTYTIDNKTDTTFELSATNTTGFSAYNDSGTNVVETDIRTIQIASDVLGGMTFRGIDFVTPNSYARPFQCNGRGVEISGCYFRNVESQDLIQLEAASAHCVVGQNADAGGTLSVPAVSDAGTFNNVYPAGNVIHRLSAPSSTSGGAGADETLSSFVIQPSFIRPNSVVRAVAWGSVASASAATHIGKFEWGSGGNQYTFYPSSGASGVEWRAEIDIMLTTSDTVQRVTWESSRSGNATTDATVYKDATTGTIDTSSSITFSVIGTSTDAADAFTLEGLYVEIK